MIFLAIGTAAILGVITGKLVYTMTHKNQLSVGSQLAIKNERVYNGIKK